jgi:hypothetical protein
MLVLSEYSACNKDRTVVFEGSVLYLSCHLVVCLHDEKSGLRVMSRIAHCLGRLAVSDE